MYQYDQYDQTIVDERVAQYRDQVRRRLSGELSEEEFRPLRLQNGLYLQRHAYMHRIAIPYGNLRSDQMRMLAHVARRYDPLTGAQGMRFGLELVSGGGPPLLATAALLSKPTPRSASACANRRTRAYHAA